GPGPPPRGSSGSARRNASGFRGCSWRRCADSNDARLWWRSRKDHDVLAPGAADGPCTETDAGNFVAGSTECFVLHGSVISNCPATCHGPVWRCLFRLRYFDCSRAFLTASMSTRRALPIRQEVAEPALLAPTIRTESDPGVTVPDVLVSEIDLALASPEQGSGSSSRCAWFDSSYTSTACSPIADQRTWRPSVLAVRKLSTGVEWST